MFSKINKYKPTKLYFNKFIAVYNYPYPYFIVFYILINLNLLVLIKKYYCKELYVEKQIK